MSLQLTCKAAGAIRNLPPEIMALIFEFCVHCDAEVPFANKNIAPLLLGRVSQYWRHCALSTPSLWCSLRLSFDHSDARLALLKTWLTRSGRTPLTLNLVNYYRSDRHRSDGVVDVLRGHSPQVETLRLRLPHAAIVRIAQCPFPLLRHADIGWIGSEPPGIISIFGDAPALREFTTDAAVLATILSCSAFPWTQLTSFTCSGYTVIQCLEVLCLASSLEHCAFSAQNHGNNIPPIASIPLAHPNLRSLSLFDSWDSLDILQRVQLPALEQLTFTVQPYSAEFMHAAIPRLFPWIQKLDLTFLPTSGVPLIEYLRSLISLVDLRVKQICGPVSISLCVALRAETMLLRNLETLHVECDDDRGLYPPLVKMLVRRREGFRPLKSVVFDFRVSIDTPDDDDFSVICALRKEGMHLNFSAGYTYGGQGWVDIVRPPGEWFD
ncbi:hypothetical protein C8R44DRAFT_872489 [Mycena epipterygia]|nr:hypothetical protein C8R44DRAFT_872489 [Mycena epipterygia]